MSEYADLAFTLTDLMHRASVDEEDFQGPPKFTMENDLATWVFTIGTDPPYRRSVLTVTERAFDEFDPGLQAHRVMDVLEGQDWKQHVRDVRFEDDFDLRLGQDLILSRVPASDD